ncbi:sensor histidine kinase [Streptomyces sp. XM4011]|uniref:histidine kinase n=2 Tax=Streptomyces TaxID=1883 RepID=A0A1I6RSK7_9ACTN|nr:MULTISPECIES: sensor histidine kinase [Streptomyces]MCK1814099.1 sensor histidine kinase [Streptomyces sp. XM4011]QKV68463.1 sensor histidine kinase [Streptomyces harbinensis]SFS67626.1 Signal transduction histidine kinase [Streptomyces harbinensis]
MSTERARDSLLAAARALLLMAASIIGSLLLFIFSVLSLAFLPLGLGFLSTPLVVGLTRAHANQRRLLAHDWSGVTIRSAYRPLPEQRGGLAGRVDRTVQLLRDPATWRDLLWLLVDATAGFTAVVFAPALLLYGVYGLVLLAGVWQPIFDASGTIWFAFVPISSWFTAALAAVTGIGLFVLGLFLNPLILRGHFVLCRLFIGASHKQQLAQRVARLTETRHDAVDSSAAELRRIERDLHDGAQARLVAMGMSLGAVEALLEKDPAQARELLAQARASSAEALTELRDLVRGIHPPVLAERGLGDAVKALALRMRIPVEVDVELPGRLAEPVETAAYFAVSEVLTNAAKHSGADRIWLDIYYGDADRTLKIAVTDNGRGGASLDGGTGLRGIERRLGPFDGVLALSSPAGGPTLVTIEVPCDPPVARG